MQKNIQKIVWICFSRPIRNMQVICMVWFSELYHNPSILTELLMNSSQTLCLTQCFTETESANEQMQTLLKYCLEITLHSIEFITRWTKVILPFSMGHAALHRGFTLKTISLSSYKVPAESHLQKFYQIPSPEKIC